MRPKTVMQGKTIVITGGLGALGSAVAEAAAKRGASVALLDHAPTVPKGFSERLGTNTLIVGGIDLTSLTAAETAMASIVRESLARTDDARSLLRDLFRSEADILPDVEQQVLRVQVHPMSNPRSDRAIAHLLEHLNAAEFTYPGTHLRLVYSIASEAESPNSAPHQNPAGQEI